MTTESRELDTLVKAAIGEIEKGNISLKDVLLALSPEQKSAEVAVLPVPQEITEEQKTAVKKVAKVFGQIVPTERRELTPEEVTALAEEKETLDQLKKMAESRWENIKIAVHNHLDIEAEKSGDAEGALRSEKGHYILGGKVRGTPDTPKKWSREVRQNSPSVSASALKALADDPEVEDFTHEDYLAATTQTRVLDENKLMLLLKKRPELVIALQKVIKPGSKTASLYLRKA